jgi:hypothetical protein
MTLPSHYIKFGWTQNVAARDKDGNEVLPSSEDACCWCIYGAIGASRKDLSRETRYKYENKVEEVIGNYSISLYNDSPARTKQEVIDILEQVERELGLR